MSLCIRAFIVAADRTCFHNPRLAEGGVAFTIYFCLVDFQFVGWGVWRRQIKLQHTIIDTDDVTVASATWSMCWKEHIFHAASGWHWLLLVLKILRGYGAHADCHSALVGTMPLLLYVSFCKLFELALWLITECSSGCSHRCGCWLR